MRSDADGSPARPAAGVRWVGAALALLATVLVGAWLTLLASPHPLRNLLLSLALGGCLAAAYLLLGRRSGHLRDKPASTGAPGPSGADLAEPSRADLAEPSRAEVAEPSRPAVTEPSPPDAVESSGRELKERGRLGVRGRVRSSTVSGRPGAPVLGTLPTSAQLACALTHRSDVPRSDVPSTVVGAGGPEGPGTSDGPGTPVGPGTAVAQLLESVLTALRAWGGSGHDAGAGAGGSMTRDVGTVLVTSPSAGDGSSTVALTLAAAAVRGGRPVVLVDGNLGAPRLASSLGLLEDVGLSDVLAGRVAVTDAVQPTQDDLLVLAAGGHPVHRTEDALASTEMQQLLLSMADEVLVVVDMPPVDALDEAALTSLASLPGLLLLLVTSPSTSDEDVRTVLSRLPGAQVGLVVNRADPQEVGSGRRPATTAAVTTASGTP